MAVCAMHEPGDEDEYAILKQEEQSVIIRSDVHTFGDRKIQPCKKDSEQDEDAQYFDIAQVGAVLL